MAEDFDPVEEGKRIAREYLSKRGWAREWRRSEEAEETFSAKVERWRKDPSPQAKEVLRVIAQILGSRKDLGFFGKRIVDRLTRELGPL